MPSTAELLDIAVTVARRAAALAQQRRRDGVEVAASKSTLTDIVTKADREAESLIRDALAAARPRDGFLGEETGRTQGAAGSPGWWTRSTGLSITSTASPPMR